jgi:hypothetical protein
MFDTYVQNGSLRKGQESAMSFRVSQFFIEQSHRSVLCLFPLYILEVKNNINTEDLHMFDT